MEFKIYNSKFIIPFLAAYCGFLFFYGLGAGELYRNETLRAIIARNMLETGNWIVPTLYGQPLFTKPPGMYLAIALASLPFGEVTEWTARLPSALAATAFVFLVYWFFTTQVSRRAGLVAALILPMSIFWLERATSAEIDMMQVAWIGASILLFVRGLLSAPDGRPTSLPLRWILPALLCVAAGTLTKWTAPAFFYLTALTLLWLRGQVRLLFGWQHLVSAALAGSLVVLWIGLAVVQTGWDVFYATVSREALQHLAPGHGRHAFPWLDMLLHPLKVLGATLPWSLLALYTLRPAFTATLDDKGRLIVQALHAWTWPNILFWSLASEHSLRHAAPLFAAPACLAAMVVALWWEGKIQLAPRLRAPQFIAGALAVWIVIKVLFVEVALPARFAKRQARDKGEMLASLVPAETVLYLFRIKDEGLLFYFGRAALRLDNPTELPFTNEPLYCILTRAEWAGWTGPAAEVVSEMADGQGDPIVLVRISRSS